MKKTSFMAALLVLASGAFAQKVDLDRYVFTATYRGLPEAPLSPEYRTYSYNINSTSSVRNNFTDDQVKNIIGIEGWKKVDSRGHIIVNVNLEDLVIESSEMKSREEEIKDKDGKVTGKKTYYYAQAIYSWAGSASVNDYKGNAIMRTYGLADRNNKMTWKSNEYGTSSDAANYYNNNKYEIRNALTKEVVTNALTQFQRSLNYRYGFRVVADQDFMWIMDSKKHPENDAQKAAWGSIKEAMKMMNAKDSLATVKEKLAPAIAYFDSLKTRITGTEKADKKLRYGAYYTLAKIYLLLDQPDLAIKEAEGLIANEYDEKDGKRLKEEAEGLKKLFDANKIYTRHFDINVDAFTPPAS
jgi:hypothetical protein